MYLSLYLYNKNINKTHFLFIFIYCYFIDKNVMISQKDLIMTVCYMYCKISMQHLSRNNSVIMNGNVIGMLFSNYNDIICTLTNKYYFEC